MTEDKFMKGTPPPILLPAKNYIFKISDENYLIRLPRSGNYHDIDPGFFDVDSGNFNIYDERSRTLYLPSITKVLFATKQYPDLKFNQFFVPYAITFEDAEVIIIGQIIDMMLPIDKTSDNTDDKTED